MSRERPILMNAPMVRATLSGSKLQTRRPIKRPKETCAECWAAACPHNREGLVEADGTPNIAGEVFGTQPYLRVQFCEHTGYTGARHRAPFETGDVLWVRETWAHEDPAKSYLPVAYRADGVFGANGGDGDGGRLFVRHGWLIDRSPPDATGQCMSLAKTGDVDG